MKDQVEVCSLSRGVIWSRDSTPIHPITGWPSLFPPSHTRTPIGLSYDSLSSHEEEYGVVYGGTAYGMMLELANTYRNAGGKSLVGVFARDLISTLSILITGKINKRLIVAAV